MKLPSLFLFVLFFAACSAESPKGQPLAERHFFKSEKKPVGVTAATVTAREIPLVIQTTGKTEASDRYVAKAPADSKIQKVFVEEGAKVQPGDPLVKFDDQAAVLRSTVARAEIREAEAGLENDNFLKANREQLITDGKLSAVEADWVDKRIELRQATLERAKAEIDMYEKLTDLGQLNSPIAGLVTKRNVAEGTDVSEDQELLEVVRVDPMQFVFAVPVDEVSALQATPEISIKFPGIPGQEFTGEVASVGAEAGKEGAAAGGTGMITVKVNIPNPDLLLKAEIRGDLVIRTTAKKKILPVLDAALVKSERSTFVFKIEGNKIRKVPVELGEPFNGQPTVAKGIAEGDLIVAAAGGEDLQDGVPVEVQTTRASN